jgi:hypothetical protein
VWKSLTIPNLKTLIFVLGLVHSWVDHVGYNGNGIQIAVFFFFEIIFDVKKGK